MFESIFFSLWFFAPAGLGNLCAFASGKIRFLKKYNYPVDGFKKFRGKRILGSHKTVRGFIFAIVIGMISCSLEVLFYNTFSCFRYIISLDYSSVNPILLGGLLGFGALWGDAVKSFFKRQKGIQPGRSWFPFDQTDYIIGGLFVSLLYIRLPIVDYLLIFIIWFLLHPLVTFIGFLLKLRHKPL